MTYRARDGTLIMEEFPLLGVLYAKMAPWDAEKPQKTPFCGQQTYPGGLFSWETLFADIGVRPWKMELFGVNKRVNTPNIGGNTNEIQKELEAVL